MSKFIKQVRLSEHPGHVDQSVHNPHKGGIKGAQDKVKERAAALGYENVTFTKNKKGLLEAVSGKTRLNIFIDPDGRILGKGGRPLAW